MMTSVAAAETRHDALRDLFDACYPSLVRLAALLVDDRATAEEVVQDAFVGMHARWDRLDEDRALAYLRAAVLNGARSVLRRRGTARQFLERQRTRQIEEPGGDNTESAAVSAATRQEVLGAIRRLPDTQRNVVLLRYYLDCSEAEIAATLGVTPGTVKTSAHRALAKLAPALEALR